MKPFEVNVADLRRSRAEEREIEVSAAVDWALELSRIESARDGLGNLRAELALTPIGGGLLAHGTAEFRAQHVCHRCLETWSEPMTVPVSAMFSARAAQEDDETFPLADVIDLEPALRDDVLLALPLSPTCPDGCEVQLVDTRENGLNNPAPAGRASADSIPEDQLDEGSPFSVLRDFLDGDD